MLQLGSSVPWPEALEAFTGSRQMSVKPIRSFFEPLRAWLEKENKRNRDELGWEENYNII